MGALSFYLIYVLLWGLSLFPARMLYVFSDVLYLLVYYGLKYRKTVVYTNLSRAFPEKTPAEITQIAKRFYRHFMDVFVEVVMMIHMREEEMKKRVRYINGQLFETYYQQGKHVIAGIGHYGNWEWLAGFPTGTGTPHLPITIYKTLSNKYVDRLMTSLRGKYGVEPVSMERIYRTIIAYNNQKQLTATGFIADQTPPPGETHYWTSFLNQDTPVYLGIEKMAKKFNAAVLFFDMRKIKRGYYEVEVVPLFDDVTSAEQSVITEKHVRKLEEMICREPQYWLWTHRRWKRKREHPEGIVQGI